MQFKFDINRSLFISLLILAVLTTPSVFAESIETQLPSGITISANFHKGLATRPAVLFLHGFQQTAHSEPLNSLAGSLAAKGYTVLNPTLSLGVNHRSQSMPCEAVHTHTMDQEVIEIAYWTEWLHKKVKGQIVLAGFSSTGNIGMLLYSSQLSNSNIKKIILIAPNPPIIDPRQKKKTQFAFKTASQADEQKLGIFTFAYCKNNFTSTANSYLSYAKYDQQTFLDLIKKSPVPTELIIGEADTVITTEWASQLKALRSPERITLINNANHFFEGTSEFDLADEFENSLKN